MNRENSEIEICAIQGNYAAYCGNFLPTVRDNLSVPSSRVKNPRSGSLKSRKPELYSKAARKWKIFRCFCCCADRSGMPCVLSIQEDSGTDDSREETPETTIRMWKIGARISAIWLEIWKQKTA